MSDDDEIPYIKRKRTLHYGSLEEVERKRLEDAAAAGAKTLESATEKSAEPLENIDSDDNEHDNDDDDHDDDDNDVVSDNDNDDVVENVAIDESVPTTTTTKTAKKKTTKASKTSGEQLPTAGKLANKIDDDYFDIDTELTKEKIALLAEFERKRRARQINVSTDDTEVKNNLRQLNEPICFFGEGPAERRRRLKDLLATLGENAIKQKQTEEHERRQQQKVQESTWYHEGPEALRTARLWLANYSLPRAKLRLEQARDARQMPSAKRAGLMVELQKRLQFMVPQCSQVGDTRPLSCATFNDDSDILLTSSWSGVCKLWSVPTCEVKQILRGHTAYIGSVAFRPNVKQDNLHEVAMASSSHDGAVKLWAFGSEESIADITGHMPNRVSKVKFHPSGRFLATACYDASWRLWDLEQKSEVLHQEGHAKAVHCLSFQTDGSVIATGGLDAFGRVWDLRTGRCIMFLEGHLGSIFGVDFAPNGYHIATASQDNSCKIWDLRRRQPVYTIPAHTNLLSDVRYQHDGGSFLVTCSYDCTVKLWSHKTWQPLKTLHGHDGKVTSVDVSPNSEYIVSTSYDRTFKLWAPED